MNITVRYNLNNARVRHLAAAPGRLRVLNSIATARSPDGPGGQRAIAALHTDRNGVWPGGPIREEIAYDYTRTAMSKCIATL